MKFGCCISTKEYAVAETTAFDFVEFAGVEIAAMSEKDFQDLCQQVSGGKLPCLAINSYCAGEPAIVGDRFDVKKAREYAEYLCARAEKLGAKVIGIGVPPARQLPEGYDKALADAQCREFLKVTAEAAKDHGIRINYESLSAAVCNYGIRMEEAVSLVRDIGMENLSLVVDFYHRYVEKEDICNFEGFEDLIFHTHISTCGPQAERGFPGMDELAYYRDILNALKAAGYNDTMSLEAHADDLLEEGNAALEMLHLADAG